MWKIERRCIKCKRVLSQDQYYYSQGCCPHCGKNNTGTICTATEHPYRVKKEVPWWKFWEKEERVYS